MTNFKNPKYNRLSAALRQNLLKRKEQQRNRTHHEVKSGLKENPEKKNESFKSTLTCPSSEDQGEIK